KAEEHGAQGPTNTPVCDHDGVARDLGNPSADTLRQHLVALPTLRPPIPDIGLARRISRRVAHRDVAPGLAFPAAVVDFHQPVVSAVGAAVEAHFGAQDLHRLARTLEGACYVVKLRRAIAEGRREQLTVALGLRPAGGVERNVPLPLIALPPVPIGLPMANVVERDPRLQHCCCPSYAHNVAL